MTTPKIVYVTGTITTEDGVDRQFSIGPLAGIMQWGPETRHLGDTIGAVTVMRNALSDHGFLADPNAEPVDEPDDDDDDDDDDDELTRDDYLEQYPHDEHVGLDMPDGYGS